jgi:hypothetical protein
MVRMEVTIDDRQWPKLSLLINRTGLSGQRTVHTRQFQYDGAYSQFENDLHNQLRPMIDELVKRRLGK